MHLPPPLSEELPSSRGKVWRRSDSKELGDGRHSALRDRAVGACGLGDSRCAGCRRMETYGAFVHATGTVKCAESDRRRRGERANKGIPLAGTELIGSEQKHTARLA